MNLVWIRHCHYFALLLYIPANNYMYGHGWMVSLPNHTLFMGKLEQAVNQFVHILLLITDNLTTTLLK